MKEKILKPGDLAISKYAFENELDYQEIVLIVSVIETYLGVIKPHQLFNVLSKCGMIKVHDEYLETFE